MLWFELLVAPALMAAPAPQDPSMGAYGICLDQVVRKRVAELVEAWANNYAFSKVIIGTDGRFGDVGPPRSYEAVGGDVICRTDYRLVRVGPQGAYRVAIKELTFRAKLEQGRYTLVLEDLPTALDGSDEQTRALLSRFTVNERPYLDVLEENRARVAEQGGRP